MIHQVKKHYLSFKNALVIVGALSCMPGFAYADSPSADKTTTIQQEKKSIEELKALALSGDAKAQGLLGRKYFWGNEELPKDEAEGLKWYQRAADGGNNSAKVGLYYAYQMSSDIKLREANKEKVNKLVREAADEGYAHAQFLVGRMYFEAQKTSKDNMAEALKWYQRSADQGFILAQTELAYIYKEGAGVEKNYAMAAKFYQDASEKGGLDAKDELDSLYNEMFHQYDDEWLAWIQDAAKNGDAAAQYRLALLCFDGSRVKEDEKQGWRWLFASADQSYPKALLALVLSRSHNNKSDPSLPVIENWFTEKASKGNAAIQYDIGAIYQDGYNLIKPNEEEAIKWYSLAADQGNDQAKAKLKELGQE